jgi:hypothetical protein
MDYSYIYAQNINYFPRSTAGLYQLQKPKGKYRHKENDKNNEGRASLAERVEERSRVK